MLAERPVAERFFRAIWSAVGGDPDAEDLVGITGSGSVACAFSVSDFATASFATAGAAAAALVAAGGGPSPRVTVDRGLASAWMTRSAGLVRFSPALRPIGWKGPPVLDELGGLYPTADGRWIHLYMNHPHFASDALRVLGAAPSREAVAAEVARSAADEVERAVLDGGGCVAASRTLAEWAEHPQGKTVAAEPLIDVAPTLEAPDDGWRPTPERPLAGIRVLDVTRVISGPTATRLLAGLGAEVLRIDPPDFDDPAADDDIVLGKRCARLDLKSEQGRAQFLALLGEADVLVHGLRPGAMEGLGLGADVLDSTRPGLVEVRLDAYGWSGPWQGRRGFDGIVETASGMAIENARWSGNEVPTALPIPILDLGTGNLLATAALQGLRRRVLTGQGSRSRCALARTAAIVVEAGPPPHDVPLPSPYPGPFDERVHSTASGPARRLVPPFVLDGAPLFWERPGERLGSSAPVWSGLRSAGRTGIAQTR